MMYRHTIEIMLFLTALFSLLLLQIHANSKALVPSKSISFPPTSTMTDRIRNSDLLIQLRDEAIMATRIAFEGREEALSDIKSSQHDVPLRVEHAKQKIREYKENYCSLDDIDECLRDPVKLVRAQDMLESLYNAAAAVSKESSHALEKGLIIANSMEMKKELAICYIGTTVSVTGIGAAIVEIIIPWLIPGTLGGPLGLACASMAIGGAALSVAKCNDPLVAYLDTVKRMAQAGAIAGTAAGALYLFTGIDLTQLAYIMSHIDHVNAEVVRELINAIMSSF